MCPFKLAGPGVETSPTHLPYEAIFVVIDSHMRSLENGMIGARAMNHVNLQVLLRLGVQKARMLIGILRQGLLNDKNVRHFQWDVSR